MHSCTKPWFIMRQGSGGYLQNCKLIHAKLKKIDLRITSRPWQNRLNWIPDPAPATSRDHGIEKSPKGPKEDEENRPPASHPSRIHRKIRPRRRKRTHRQQHLAGTNENLPGIDLRPRWMKQTPQKHPQPPQHPKHPQHPLSAAANENSSRVNLWNQVNPGRLYKQAQGSRVKESTKRSRRGYFSGSPPSFSSKQPRRDYFSGPSPHSRACRGPDTELLLQPQTHRGRTEAEPQGGAISLPQSGCHPVSHHPQSPPRSARPDLVLEVGLEPPAADLTSRIQCVDQQDAENSTSRIPLEELPPVIIEIPSGSPELEEELPRDPESH